MRNKKILLLVSGMSPQIVTETLYALAVTQQPPWLPDEIRLITTLQGQQQANLQLLQGSKRFATFLRDYAITHPIHFDISTIEVIATEDGNPLNDLRTPAENQAAADTICNRVRELTLDPTTELHVSLAGGRKTMGFYIGYALALFGRSQDQLSHVLVSEDFESNRDFFYPTPYTHPIPHKDGRELDASQAQVWLATIPFVRMRSGLPQNLLQGQHSFSQTVALAREAAEVPELVINPKQLRITIHKRTAKLSPIQMAVLLWVYQKRLIPTAELILPSRLYAQELAAIADAYGIDLRDSSEKALKDGMSKEIMQHTASRFNKTLIKYFGNDVAQRCKLASRKFGREKAYALPDDLIITLE